MDTKVIDERAFVVDFKATNQDAFYAFIEDYEAYIAPYLRAAGYRCLNRSERTVLFTFGEVTFSRTRWYKNGKCRVPVDEKLGLERHGRYSKELLYQIAKLATMTSYRQVVAIIEMTYHIIITKDTVTRAVKLAGQLLEEKKDYRFYEESAAPEKLKADTIYVEGDGLHLKIKENQQSMELSRFVIHTGSEKVGKNRYRLLHKKEITSTKNSEARKQVLDYIYNHFEISDQTILITNSDGGKGYTPYVFKELAKALRVKRHEHFWDSYHLNKDIKRLGLKYGSEMSELLFKAIKGHDKGQLRLAFDTMEALTPEGEDEWLDSYRKKFVKNFQYTLSPMDRGLSTQGIGIMESQHRKISYRMKHRGMYWTRFGANSVAQMIGLREEGKLRDLFFGQWREEYQKIKAVTQPASRYLGHVETSSFFQRTHRSTGRRRRPTVKR